jgi:hypothetical protein
MPAMLGRVAAHGSKENTEPVAPSSTTPTNFPPGLAASAYDPQERLQPRSAPYSVHRQPTTGNAPAQDPLIDEPRKEREPPSTGAESEAKSNLSAQLRIVPIGDRAAAPPAYRQLRIARAGVRHITGLSDLANHRATIGHLNSLG